MRQKHSTNVRTEEVVERKMKEVQQFLCGGTSLSLTSTTSNISKSYKRVVRDYISDFTIDEDEADNEED